MLKNLIQSILLIARDFEIKMRMLDRTFKGQDTLKVRVTEAQLGILEYCAFLGVKNYCDLKKYTQIDMPRPSDCYQTSRGFGFGTSRDIC